MKKIFLILSIVFGVMLSGCRNEELNPNSVIPDYETEMDEFDKWIDVYYRSTYNMRFLYKFSLIESDLTEDVVPAKVLDSKVIAKLIQFLWLDAYTEVAGLDFMRQNAPRVVHLVGSGAYVNGTLRLGVAEGGKKITIMVVNWVTEMMTVTYNNGKDETDGYTLSNFDTKEINTYFLHTIHHEFSHILDQNIEHPVEFDNISAADYTASWTNVEEETALKLGFVSRYASSSADEDFAEVFSTFITSTDNEWNAILLSAGDEGGAKINQKLSVIKKYTKDAWNLDLDQLRMVLMRRYQELEKLNWDNFEI